MHLHRSLPARDKRGQEWAPLVFRLRRLPQIIIRVTRISTDSD